MTPRARTALLTAVLAVGLSLVSATPARAAVFANSAAITVNDATCASVPGAATPYPSSIAVSGLNGTVTDVNVTLAGVTHAAEGDLEILLVSPVGGANLVLLSDAGTGGLADATVTFDDLAPAQAPQSTAWGAGTYKPTNYSEAAPDAFPAPAPAPSTSTTLNTAFSGINPNGTWSLYVVDDTCTNAGSIAGGWSLDIAVTNGFVSSTDVVSSLNPSRTGQSVTFTSTTRSLNQPVTSGTVTFSDEATVLAANVPVDAAGQASFTTSSLAEGTHPVKATFNGTPAAASSFDTENQQVDNDTVVTGGEFCNPGPVTITDNTRATPYPSRVFVTGAPASLTDVNVTLRNVSHGFVGDVDVMLVGPTGQNLVLVSDSGTLAVSNVTVLVDDAAPNQLAQFGPWAPPSTTVSTKPVNRADLQPDNFFPGPAPSAATTLAAFNGTDPNGAWRLYVVDDVAPDGGVIASGWCLTITPAPVPQADVRANKAGPAQVTAGVSYSYTISATNLGPATAENVVLTDTLPSGVDFVSAPGCTYAAPTVTCPGGTLESGASSPAYAITVTPRRTNSFGTVLTNTVTASSSTADPNASNNTATVTSTQSGCTTTVGTSGNDVICPRARGGSVQGGAGNDVLYGGPSGDTLQGGAGDDILLGGNGNDVLQGGNGNDRLYGEAGNDILQGGANHDFADGGAGRDTCQQNESQSNCP